MITAKQLNRLRDEAYATACNKGFHDEKHSDEHYLMLVITEIAEAVQADRMGLHVHKAIKDRYKDFVIDAEEPFEPFYRSEISGRVEDELADIIIRMLDYCGMRKIEFREDNDGFPFDRLTAFRTFPEAMYDLCEMIVREDLPMEFPLRCVIYYCESFGIDILWFVEMKMRYNETRERMHGRKY